MSLFELEASTNPFPGLRPFHESEQHLFFGRESQIDAMVDKLAANRFLAVVGSSGSGKSSLVNCGLRPALRTGLMAKAGTAWRMAQCRPGGDPIAALSNALAVDGVLFTNYQDAGMSLAEIIETTLRMGKLGLLDIVEQAQLAEGCNLLLVIDQFEELFRYRDLDEHDENKNAEIGQQATAFVNLLLTVVEQSALPVYVVITMRSDFLGDCTHFPGLAEAINSGQYLVPRMTREQRRAAIFGPIRVRGAKLYLPLLTRLVNDVGSNPDQLSILQHALNRTWSYWEIERGRQGMLDIECYESIGSMTSALDQHADQAFAELNSQEKKYICETIFKALTNKASDARGVRRPTRLKTLCDMCNATPAAVVSVINVFRESSRSFLMPPEGVELRPDTVIDISHESLMRVWKRLNRWADEEADAARKYQRLAETSELYKKDDAGLLRDADLRLAQRWRKENKPNAIWANQYNPNFDGAMSFLEQSEKSDVMRKRWRHGLIAAVFLVLFGSPYIKAKIDLEKQKEQAQIELENQEKLAQMELDKAEMELDKAEMELDKAEMELDEAEQEVISAINDADKSKNEVAEEQMRFIDAISSLEAEQVKDVIKYFVQREEDRKAAQDKSSELLDRYQKLRSQKENLCYTSSVNDEAEQQDVGKNKTYCKQSPEEDSLFAVIHNGCDVALPEYTPGAFLEDILPELDGPKRNRVVKRDKQIVCEIKTLEVKNLELETAITNVESDINSLGGTVDAIKLTENLDDESAGSKSASAGSTNSVIARKDSQLPILKQFQACKNVVSLTPSGCRTADDSFPPGKVFIFARVVTKNNDEKLTLKWFNNETDEPFKEREFTVQPNPDGYRTFTWKSLDSGAYRTCLSNHLGIEIECIPIRVK